MVGDGQMVSIVKQAIGLKYLKKLPAMVGNFAIIISNDYQ